MDGMIGNVMGGIGKIQTQTFFELAAMGIKLPDDDVDEATKEYAKAFDENLAKVDPVKDIVEMMREHQKDSTPSP